MQRQIEITAAQVDERVRAFRKVAENCPCFCGREKMFKDLTVAELDAAIKAGTMQILFFELIDMPEERQVDAFGFVQHLFYALLAKEADVLSDSILEN